MLRNSSSEKCSLPLKINSHCQVCRYFKFHGEKKKKPDGKKKENLSIPEQFNKSEDILVFSFSKKREATAGPYKEASSAPHLVSLRSSQAAKGQPTSPGMKSVGNRVLHYLAKTSTPQRQDDRPIHSCRFLYDREQSSHLSSPSIKTRIRYVS